jgi:hypothetical protein
LKEHRRTTADLGATTIERMAFAEAFSSGQCAGSARICRMDMETPLLYYNGLKDRTDKKHVYTPAAINLLDVLALPATILMIYHQSALQGTMENSNGPHRRGRHSCMENEARLVGLVLPQLVTRD